MIDTPMSRIDKYESIYQWAESLGILSDTGRVYPFSNRDNWSAQWDFSVDLTAIDPAHYLKVVFKAISDDGVTCGKNQIRVAFRDLMTIEEF